MNRAARVLTFFHSAWPSRIVNWYVLCTHQPLVQVVLLQRS